MTDKPWKQFERRIAKSLNTERTPLSGIASRHTSSDTLHKDLYVECKSTSRSATCSLFRTVRERARREHKLSVLSLHQKGYPGTVAVVDWDLFVRLWYCFIDVAIEHGWPEGDHFIESCKIDTEKKGVTHDRDRARQGRAVVARP